MVAQDKRTAVPEDDGDGGGAEKLAHRVRHLLPAVNAGDGLAELFVGLLEAFLYLLLSVESLDDAQSAQRLFDLAHQSAPLLLPFEGLTLQLLPHLPHHIAGKRQEDKDKQGELPTDSNHADEVNRNEDGVFEEHVERAHHRGFDFVHVARDAGQDVALPLLGEESERELGYLAVNLVADIADHASADRNHREEGQVHR